MKAKWVLAAAAGLLSVGLAVLAQGALQRAKLAEELGLNPEQTQKLKELRYENQRQMLDIRHDLGAKMLDYRHELGKDNPDPQVLDRLTDEASALRAKMMKARTHHLLDVKKILTPEQWAKAKTLLLEHSEDRREGFRQRTRGDRPGRGGGGRGMGFEGLGPGGGGPPMDQPPPGPGPGAP